MTLDPNDKITPAELGAVVGLDTPDVLCFMHENGPFKAEADGFLRLRVALGLAVYALCGMRFLVDPKLAAQAACEAANGADPDEDKQLVIGWHQGKPTMGWADKAHPLPEPTEHWGDAWRMPILAIPADRMLRDLGAAVLDLREASRGKAH